MLKVKKYFETIGFAGNDLEKILNAFELQSFKKNDFIVVDIGIEEISGFFQISRSLLRQKMRNTCYLRQ